MKILVYTSIHLLLCILNFEFKFQNNSNGANGESFNTFYKRFYKDSTFQISRVVFPLPGFNSDIYDQESRKSLKYFWEKKDWIFLKTLEGSYKKFLKKDWEEEYYKVIKKGSNNTMFETIYMKESGYSEVRKFKLIHAKWYLYYYSYKNY